LAPQKATFLPEGFCHRSATEIAFRRANIARVFLSKLSIINTQKDDYLRTAPHRLFQSVTIW